MKRGGGPNGTDGGWIWEDGSVFARRNGEELFSDLTVLASGGWVCLAVSLADVIVIRGIGSVGFLRPKL